MARFDESRDRAGEAIAIAQEVAATEEEGAARVVLGVVLAFLGDPTAGESELRDGLRLALRRRWERKSSCDPGSLPNDRRRG